MPLKGRVKKVFSNLGKCKEFLVRARFALAIQLLLPKTIMNVQTQIDHSLMDNLASALFWHTWAETLQDYAHRMRSGTNFV